MQHDDTPSPPRSAETEGSAAAAHGRQRGLSLPSPQLEAALRYIARGWRVLPLAWPLRVGDAPVCSCARGDCARIGKHPDGRLVRHGARDATTDPATIRAWWQREPNANVGLALGAGEPGEHNRRGLWVLDVDTAKGGDVALVQLVRAHGELGPTLHAHTGSGGDHFFFTWPGQRIAQAAHRLGQGLDVIAAGWYVVAAPSLHASGGVYAWEDDAAPVLDAPGWLLERVLHPAEPRAPSPPVAPFTSRRGGDVVRRAIAYLEAMPPAIAGQAGDRQTMKAIVATVRGFALAPATALALLVEHYNPRCVPPWKEAELARKIEYVARTHGGALGYLVSAA